MLHKKLKSFDKGAEKNENKIFTFIVILRRSRQTIFIFITSLKDCTRFMFVEKKLKQFKKSSIILNLLDSFDAK